MRISDWSSDVCSSDLADQRPRYLLRLQSGRLVQPVLLLMEQATEAQAEKAIAVLKRAIDAAENSNQAGENFVVGAANWRPLHRSEERRVGKECVRTFRSRGSPDH